MSVKCYEDYRLNNVPVQVELLYYKMLTKTDSEGRWKGEAKLFNKTFMPLRDYTDKQIENWIRLLVEQFS